MQYGWCESSPIKAYFYKLFQSIIALCDHKLAIKKISHVTYLLSLLNKIFIQMQFGY